MNIVHLTQGSPEWLAHRLHHFNASDAPAMMGCSPYKTRAALIRELATGLTADVDAGTQRLFDAGHRFEALARPLAEKIIGEELYPVVGTLGKLSASFDGLTLMNDTAFEHKTLNESLRAAIRQQGGNANDFLAPAYRVQMEQQCMVSGATRVLFIASKWDGDTLVEERHCWYTPDLTLRAQIQAGWDQLEKDVAAYVPEAAAEPAPVGKAPEALPALRIEVTGAVTASNLAEFKATALTAIRAVNRDLKTDTDFADAEKAVKWCADVETRLKAAKEHALSQTADIDALFRALDEISTEARSVRLDLDKLVKRRKDEVKEEAVMAARRALAQHIATLNAELAPISLQTPAVDFALAIKGLRSIASMQDALDNELANGKIAADAQARTIRANRAAMDEAEAGHLFPDFAQVCTKAAEDFANLIVSRKAAAQARIEQERERIRKEEEAKATARAEAAARQEREAAERKAREEAAAQAEVKRKADEEEFQRRRNAATVGHPDYQPLPVASIAQAVADQSRSAPAPEVSAFVASTAPAVAELPTMTLGQISARLGFTVTSDFLASLGFEAHKEKAAKLYRPSDFGAICAGISAHVLALASESKKAA